MNICALFFFLKIFSGDKKKNGVFWKHENMEKTFFSKHPLQTKKYAWKERKPSSLFTVMGSSIFYYFLFKKWKINASTVKQKTLLKIPKTSKKNTKIPVFWPNLISRFPWYFHKNNHFFSFCSRFRVFFVFLKTGIPHSSERLTSKIFWQLFSCFLNKKVRK